MFLAPALPYITAGAAVAGAGATVKGAVDARAARKDAARAEAAATAERERVMLEENRRREATSRAKAAAAGIGGLSTDMYLKSLEETGAEDVAWLKRVGASRYSARLAEGQSAYSQALSGAFGSLGTASKAITPLIKN